MWISVGLLLFVVGPALLLAEVLRYVYLEHRRDRVPILLYHRLISKAEAERGLVADEEMIWVSYDTVFADQMQYLKRAGYTTLDLDDYVRIRSGREPMPKKPVIITFDDGYVSNYRCAAPILKANGQKATIFVCLEPDLHSRQLVDGVDSFLSPEQMRKLSHGGLSIQSHTVTHCILNELNNDMAFHELAESRRRIAEITGRPVKHIAIPRSGYSRRIRRLAAQAGYETVCCNAKGSANGLSDLLGLPRIVIERDMDVEEFARVLKPTSGVMLRLTGNVKRVPERIGGARFAIGVRNLLYNGAFGRMFEARRLRRICAGAAFCYGLCCIVFLLSLLRG